MQNFTMTWTELLPLSPVIVVAITALIVMLSIAVKRNHNFIATITVLGLNLSLATAVYLFIAGLPLTADKQSVSALFELGRLVAQDPVVMGLFLVDPFSLFYMMLILVAALACCTLTHAYIDNYEDTKEELYILMLCSVAGALLMVCSVHFAAFFISLELMSIPIYGMLAYTYQRSQSLEAGIKYLVLSATASAVLLMGIAYTYSYTGTLWFEPWLRAPVKPVLDLIHEPIFIMGIALITFATAFKLSLAPFHKWTADVYQGAPAPMTAFLATVAKIAMLGLFLRLMISSSIVAIPGIETLLIILSVLSILVGNFLAFRQVNLKRILAYSSIAHFGYILIALISVKNASLVSINIYITAYMLTTIGAFGVIALMSSPYQDGKEAQSLADFRGLFWRRPVLTAVLTVMMLSLAGIPLTAGFIGKFWIFFPAVNSSQWLLLTLLIIGSGIGLYYYLRVMVVLYMTPADKPVHDAEGNWGVKAGGIMVLLLSLLVLLLGVYPEPLINLAKMAVLQPLFTPDMMQ